MERNNNSIGIVQLAIILTSIWMVVKDYQGIDMFIDIFVTCTVGVFIVSIVLGIVMALFYDGGRI